MFNRPDKTVFSQIPKDPGNSSSISIRRYTPGDGNNVLSVMKRVYIDEFGWQYAFLRGAVKTLRDMLLTYDPKRELFLLAETDIGPVGVMFLKRKSDRIAFLRWLTVTREVRNRGLGKALIECAVGFSRHAGYDSLDLVTVDRLTHAREFYRHQGFIETDRRRDTVWEMDMELCFFTRDLREEAKPSADGTAEKSPAEA